MRDARCEMRDVRCGCMIHMPATKCAGGGKGRLFFGPQCLALGVGFVCNIYCVYASALTRINIEIG